MSDALLARIEQARGLVGLFRPWNVTPEQLATLREVLASAERIATSLEPEYEYGTRVPLSEEAHGTGAYTFETQGSEQDALDAVQDRDEYFTDVLPEGSTWPKMDIVRRVRAGKWEVVS